jgi:hypothetical protein
MAELEAIGKVAGIGGIALGVLLFVFRDVIRRKIFSRLPAAETYRLMRLIIVLTFIAACVGIAAWVVGSGIVVQMTSGNGSGIFNIGTK